MITKLQQFDPSLPLLVDGYEMALRDPEEPVQLKVYFNIQSKNGYSGKHDAAQEGDSDYDKAEDAVVISREND
jgi:hypothetical protein